MGKVQRIRLHQSSSSTWTSCLALQRPRKKVFPAHYLSAVAISCVDDVTLPQILRGDNQ